MGKPRVEPAPLRLRLPGHSDPHAVEIPLELRIPQMIWLSGGGISAPPQGASVQCGRGGRAIPPGRSRSRRHSCGLVLYSCVMLVPIDRRLAGRAQATINGNEVVTVGYRSGEGGFEAVGRVVLPIFTI